MPNGLINQVSFNSWNTWQVEGGVKTPHSARHSQSQPWKHMVDRQAHWATILTWRWLTHVERGRCEGEGSRGHRSAHFLSSNAPRGPPSDGQETSAAVPPPNPNPPPRERVWPAWMPATAAHSTDLPTLQNQPKSNSGDLLPVGQHTGTNKLKYH